MKSHRDFELAGPVKFDGRTVWIGGHRLPRPEILWRKPWHQYVWDGLAQIDEGAGLEVLLNQARAKCFRGSAPGVIWLGSSDGQNAEFNVSVDGPHLLVVGATGTGKSELLRLMICGWLGQSDPIELTLIDFKGGATMSKFAGHPRVIGLATDLGVTDVLAVASTLERQLLSRQSLLAKAEVASIEEYVRAGNSLRRQIIVIDEFGELLRQHPRIVQVLEQIAARGRSLGMHLVVANQSMAGVSRSLLVNLRARVAIGEMDPIDFSQLGFRNRFKGSARDSSWRSANFKTGDGLEMGFLFPVGF